MESNGIKLQPGETDFPKRVVFFRSSKCVFDSIYSPQKFNKSENRHDVITLLWELQCQYNTIYHSCGDPFPIALLTAT